MGTFHQQPAAWVPYRNEAELDRVRAITREDIAAMNHIHPRNPNVHLDVIRNEEFEMIMLTDMFTRILNSDRYDQKVVLVMPNPCTTYRKLAYMINKCRVNCRNVKFYMMDEWADEDGNIAPLSYEAGFGNAFMRFCISQIDPALGFKMENFVYFSNETVDSYSKRLEDDGEADAIYSGPGWPGHLAFIDPVEDWYCDSLEEYMRQPAKVAKLHPMTMLQNSLHGSFGYSGDVAKVPGMGAMMGPRDAMQAKNVFDLHGITTDGTKVTWQRMISRLCIFAEPCQQLPASILQLRQKPTYIYLSENAAATVKADDYFQY